MILQIEMTSNRVFADLVFLLHFEKRKLQLHCVTKIGKGFLLEEIILSHSHFAFLEVRDFWIYITYCKRLYIYQSVHILFNLFFYFYSSIKKCLGVKANEGDHVAGKQHSTNSQNGLWQPTPSKQNNSQSLFSYFFKTDKKNFNTFYDF